MKVRFGDVRHSLEGDVVAVLIPSHFNMLNGGLQKKKWPTLLEVLRNRHLFQVSKIAYRTLRILAGESMLVN